MKIAIIVNPLIPVPPQQYGGIERIVFMLIQELISNAHDVTLFAHPDSKPNCTLVGYTDSGRFSFRDMMRINRLTSKIRLDGFDLVHTFGRMSNIARLMVSQLPKIVSYQLPPTLSQIKKAVMIAPQNSLYFTACSDYIGKQIAAVGPVTTIYNGVDIRHYKVSIDVPAEAPLVFLGRIQREKGTAIAIETARMTGKPLIIAGNVPKEPIHQQYFDEEVSPWVDGQQIRYIGPVDDCQKNALLGGASALLMPVLWDEPFGIVMTEAMACGTPVIGFRRGAIPEVVTHEVTGFVCDNVSEMIDAVQQLEFIDRRQCRTSVENRFSSKVLARRYEDLYRHVSSRQ